MTDTQYNSQAEPLYPAFLKFAGRKVVLVGGGTVAAAKHEALIAARALVTLVAPEVQAPLRQAAVAAGSIIIERPFAPSDLDDAWFAVAAAIPDVNREVAAAAAGRRLFVNAVDDPATATAYAGGVVRRGDVTVAISTGGAAPALAGLLREGLDSLIPQDLDVWLSTARDLRTHFREAQVPMPARRPQLLDALNRLYVEKGS